MPQRGSRAVRLLLGGKALGRSTGALLGAAAASHTHEEPQGEGAEAGRELCGARRGRRPPVARGAEEGPGDAAAELPGHAPGKGTRRPRPGTALPLQNWSVPGRFRGCQAGVHVPLPPPTPGVTRHVTAVQSGVRWVHPRRWGGLRGASPWRSVTGDVCELGPGPGTQICRFARKG